MTVPATSDVFFDPYDTGLIADPYPMFARLREEKPLYYNEQHDFYALSRYSDVNSCLAYTATYSSGRGNVLELIKAGIAIPPGLLVMEGPPRHDIHRRLVARMFTPRTISQLEPMVREFCARSLDPLVGSAGFDFIADLGAPMPMWVICMLLGIPEEIQETVRDHSNAQVSTEDGRPMTAASDGLDDGHRASPPNDGSAGCDDSASPCHRPRSRDRGRMDRQVNRCFDHLEPHAYPGDNRRRGNRIRPSSHLDEAAAAQ